MEKFLLSLLCFVLLFYKSNGQGYHAMLGDSSKWTVKVYIPDGGEMDVFQTIIDTVIKGKKYASMIQNPRTLFPNKFNYRLREDTTLKKVFCKSNKDTIEYTVYDFSLNKYDTIQLPVISNTTVRFVTYKVDTIFFTTTLIGTRKELKLKLFSNGSSKKDSLFWIEGIGCANNFNWIDGNWRTHPFYFFEPYYSYVWYNYTTICNFKDSVHQFLLTPSFNFGTPQCYYSEGGGIESHQKLKPISIFPNPTSSHFIIQKSTAEIVQFNLYNLIGVKVLSTALTQEQTEIKNLQLPQGAYLFSITAQSGKMIQNGKMVVE